MKHFYICLILFIIIVCSGFFTDNFVKKELTAISSRITTTNIMQEDMAVNVKAAKYRFNNKKNMLRLFINKEHIENIEKTILLMENAVTYNNKEEYSNLCIELHIRCDDAIKSLTDFF